MLLSEAIAQFSNWRYLKVKAGTVRGYELDLKMFCLYLRNPEIEKVELDHVMSFLNDLKALDWNQNTIMVKCMALRKFFEFYRLRGFQVINEELIPIPRKLFNLPRVATEEHYQKLINIIPRNKDPRHIRNLAIIQMLWDTGARNSEICSLNVSDLDLENKRTIIRTGKNRGSRPFRQIFWTEQTNCAIKNWLKKHEHLKQTVFLKEPDVLFFSICSQKSGQRMERGGVGEMLRKYSNRAKIPYMNAHSFRHHMGHKIIQEGGSDADVANILGHASLQSTMVYTMMAGKELEERYRKFRGE